MGSFLGTYCLNVLLYEFLGLDISLSANRASVEIKAIILLCLYVSICSDS